MRAHAHIPLAVACYDDVVFVSVVEYKKQRVHDIQCVVENKKYLALYVTCMHVTTLSLYIYSVMSIGYYCTIIYMV